MLWNTLEFVAQVFQWSFAVHIRVTRSTAGASAAGESDDGGVDGIMALVYSDDDTIVNNKQIMATSDLYNSNCRDLYTVSDA